MTTRLIIYMSADTPTLTMISLILTIPRHGEDHLSPSTIGLLAFSGLNGTRPVRYHRRAETSKDVDLTTNKIKLSYKAKCT